MNLNESLNKISPIIKQREMSKSKYKKLVDRNTELVDTIKDLKERIEEANTYISNNMLYDENINDCWVTVNDLLNILNTGDNNE